MTRRIRMKKTVQAKRVVLATRSDSALPRPTVDDGHKDPHWQRYCGRLYHCFVGSGAQRRQAIVSTGPGSRQDNRDPGYLRTMGVDLRIPSVLKGVQRMGHRLAAGS